MNSKGIHFYISNNPIIPLISLVVFLLLVISASYAYFTQSVGSATGAANISNANLTIPRGCTFIANATNCVILGNTATTINYNDNYISRAEMSQTYANNKIANASCFLNMGVQGTAGCRCTALVSLAGTTINYVADSLKMQITSSNTSHNQALNSISNINDFNTKLQVATTGTAVYENLSVNLQAFNVNASQNDQAGINYVYYLKSTPVCSVVQEDYTVTFDANGGSVSTTSKSVTYGDAYGTLPTPTWSGHTFRGWNGKNKLNLITAKTATANGLTLNSDNNKIHVYGTNTKTDAAWSLLTYSGLKNTFTVGDKYTLTVYKNIGTLYFQLNYKKTDNGSASFISISNNTGTFTVPSNYSSFLYAFLGVKAATGAVNENFYVQLEKGSESTPFEPYYVTQNTIVTQRGNHTLTAIWD